MEHTSSSGKIDQAGHFGSCLGLFVVVVVVVVVVAAMTWGEDLFYRRRCAPISSSSSSSRISLFFWRQNSSSLSGKNRIVVTKLLGRPRDEQTRHRPKPRSPTHTTSTTATEFDRHRCSVITAAALFVFIGFFESGVDAALFDVVVVGEFDVFFSLALRRRAINGAEEQI